LWHVFEHEMQLFPQAHPVVQTLQHDRGSSSSCSGTAVGADSRGVDFACGCFLAGFFDGAISGAGGGAGW
jgi:hypothetical protein